VRTIRVFSHYVHEPYVFLGFIEFILFFFSIYAGVFLRMGPGFGNSYFSEQFITAVVYSSVMTISFIAVGLYNAYPGEKILDISKKLGVSLIAGFVVLTLLFYLIPTLYIGRGALLLSLINSALLIAASRFLFSKIVGRNILKKRILIYGAGSRATKVDKFINNGGIVGVEVLGYVPAIGEKPVVGKQKIVDLDGSLMDYSSHREVEEIVVAVSDRRNAFPLDDLLDCKLSGIQITEAVAFIERYTGKVNIDTVHPSWLIFADGFYNSSVRELSKRLFDTVMSIVILILMSPVLFIVAAAIYIESMGRAPILYKQLRVGANARVFELLKFRSMRADAEKDGIAKWASVNDARVTKVGRLIRKYRIDELPQLINILKGDMSLIGPRPERPEFVRDLADKVAFYSERHRVKPGLAGWAQLKYPYGASEEDAIEKLQYDLYYVKHHSLLLDFYILLQTVECIIWPKGVR